LAFPGFGAQICFLTASVIGAQKLVVLEEKAVQMEIVCVRGIAKTRRERPILLENEIGHVNALLFVSFRLAIGNVYPIARTERDKASSVREESRVFKYLAQFGRSEAILSRQ